MFTSNNSCKTWYLEALFSHSRFFFSLNYVFSNIRFAICGNDSRALVPKEVIYEGKISVHVHLLWRALWSTGKVEDVLNAWDFIMTKGKTKAVIAVRKAIVPITTDRNRSRRVTSVFDCQASISWDCSCSLIPSLLPNFPNKPVLFAVTVAGLSLISALLPSFINSISTENISFHLRSA